MAWGGVGHDRLCLGKLGDSHDTMFGTFEHACIWRVVGRDELNQGSGTDWMGSLNSSDGHSI